MAEEQDRHMSREEAIAILKRGDHLEWNRVRNLQPDWIPDLSDSKDRLKLNGATINHFDLRKAKLRYAILINIKGSGAKLEGADLTHANLTDAQLYRSRLDRATLDKARLRRADLREATIYKTSLRGTQYLFGRDKADVGSMKGKEWAIYHARGDILGWHFLRSIGTLRLFGVSYLAIVAIVIFAASARWFNQALLQLQATYGHELTWLAKLPLMTMPAQFGWQLIATLALAFGATVYQFVCPQIVKEATETRWTRELRHSLVEYRSANYSRWIARYLCGLLYFGGGGYTLIYVGLRVIDALRYIFVP